METVMARTSRKMDILQLFQMPRERRVILGVDTDTHFEVCLKPVLTVTVEIELWDV